MGLSLHSFESFEVKYHDEFKPILYWDDDFFQGCSRSSELPI